jgi:hypothetical protein
MRMGKQQKGSHATIFLNLIEPLPLLDNQKMKKMIQR